MAATLIDGEKRVGSEEPELTTAPLDGDATPAWEERPIHPEDEPPSWTEPTSIREYEQAAADKLVELDETRRGNPGDHYVTYQWHVSFYGEYALRPLAHLLYDALDGAGLDVVPVERWQVPLLRVGGGDLTPAQLEKVEIRARDWAIDHHQVRLALGPPVLRPGGVSLSVTPWDEIRELKIGLWQGARSVLNYQPWLRERIPFRPHVPVAYATGPTPAADIRERLAHLADHKPVPLRVRRVTLARLTRHRGQPHWHTVADTALGSRTAFYT
ncbi:MAG: 2'-5' RNA ligase family protein [Sporichthyaceae bacterium]